MVPAQIYNKNNNYDIILKTKTKGNVCKHVYKQTVRSLSKFLARFQCPHLTNHHLANSASVIRFTLRQKSSRNRLCDYNVKDLRQVLDTA